MQLPTPDSTRLGKYTIYFWNSKEYHQIKREIFTQECYWFKSDTPTPRILDVGAHIGLASLYFKHIYPEAVVTAIEPHPAAAQLFQRNLGENGWYDIELIEKAAVGRAMSAPTTTIFADTSPEPWLSTSSLSPSGWTKKEEVAPLTVPTLHLSTLITEKIDLLKLDIEGEELAILDEVQPKLDLIERIVIESHPTSLQASLRVVQWLHDHGLTVHIPDHRFYLNPGDKMPRRLPNGLEIIWGNKS